MRAALLLASVMLLTTVPLALASERCTPAAGDRLEALPALAGLSRGWVPLLALDDSRLPAIPSVVASGPRGLCAVSADLAGFARASGITDPAQRAALAVASSYPDHLGIPEVRSMAFEGGVAKVQTWSAKDGLVVDWVVDPVTMAADFVVREVGVGAFASPAEGFEGWHPWVGFSSQYLRDLENGALVTKVRFQSLPDGKQFRLTYMTQNYASEAQADQYALDYAAASLAIWTIENAGWGFASADPDGTYDITMDGCSCIYSGNNVNIHVHAKLEDLYNFFSPPLRYPSNQHFYRIVIGHEWHHHLQYSINQWALGSYLTEGGARFSETVFEPAGAHNPNGIQYLRNANGFSNMMISTNVSPTSRSYDFGLFWGFVHGNDGGIQTIKKVYQEAGAGGDLFTVVGRALAASPGAHDTFEQAWNDFAVHAYTKSFVWGGADGASSPREWGAYLPDARRQPMSPLAPGVAQAEGAVVSRGIVLVDVPASGGTILTEYAGDQDIGARWVSAGASAAAGPVVVLDGAVDPVLLLVRGPQVANDPFERVLGQGQFQALTEAPAAVLPA